MKLRKYYYNEQKIITSCTNYYQSNDYAPFLPVQRMLFFINYLDIWSGGFGAGDLEDGIWKMEFGRWNLKRGICETKFPMISGNFVSQIP